MFERLTEPSRAVLVEAEDVAVEMGSDFISAGHILYGCAERREETAGRPLYDCGITSESIRRRLARVDVQQPGQVDPDALSAIGIDYQGVRAAVEETFGPGALEAAPDRRVSANRTPKPRFAPEAKRSLELSLRVAVELSPRRGVFVAKEKLGIQPGHLLLGLLRLDNEFVLSIVGQSATDVASLSAAVLTRLAAAA